MAKSSQVKKTEFNPARAIAPWQRDGIVRGDTMPNEFSHEFRQLFFTGLEEIARATGFDPDDVETGAPFRDQIEVLLMGAYIYAVNSLTE